ncbi:MAG: endonuclease/exonuclease/phosphatase family protein [Pseudomonadota bacterium]
MRRGLVGAVSLIVMLLQTDPAPAQTTLGRPAPPEAGAIRVAAFNVSLNRRNPGELVQDLRLGDKAKTAPQIDAVAEIIQRVRPDVILLNEIDWDRRGVSATLFRDRLMSGAGGADGVDYPHIFTASVNTGVSSGFDLDGDGRLWGARDAFGFGYFEGQYGMAILSRLPFDEAAIRTFQNLRWAEMPGALIPRDHYGEAADHLRLSSKSHWDAPVLLPDGRRLHLLASHPTPPVFDGPEDANGRRNHDEIRFWTEYATGADWMTDDAGAQGGLEAGASWVVLGDLNADPVDGDGLRAGIIGLMQIAQDPGPKSAGGAEAASVGSNRFHKGDPALDTADWKDKGGPGNLRVDFALPGPGLEIVGSGVFWPAEEDPLRRLVGEGGKASSDHRLVWVDVR